MIFTTKQKKFIIENYKGIGNEELTRLVNKKFGTSFSVSQVMGFKSRKHLNSGLNGAELPIGSESKHNGYIIVKTGEPNKWEYKQRVVYEKIHGNIPDKHKIIFLDGDKTNCDIRNLVAVKNTQIGYLTRHEYYKTSKEIVETAISLSRLVTKVRQYNNRSGKYDKKI